MIPFRREFAEMHEKTERNVLKNSADHGRFVRLPRRAIGLKEKLLTERNKGYENSRMYQTGARNHRGRG